MPDKGFELLDFSFISLLSMGMGLLSVMHVRMGLLSVVHVSV